MSKKQKKTATKTAPKSNKKPTASEIDAKDKQVQDYSKVESDLLEKLLVVQIELRS